MDRRHFLLTSLAGAIVDRLAPGAQQVGKMPRIARPRCFFWSAVEQRSSNSHIRKRLPSFTRQASNG
jgi:hypothetical protein